MRMSSKGWLAVMALATVIEIGCGDVYRPTIIPNPVNPPSPQNFHTSFTANTNGAANPGSALEIDVSGDTKAAQTSVGIGPVHLAIQAGSVSQSTRVWAANNVADSISVFTASSNLGTVSTPTTINLPIPAPLPCSDATTYIPRPQPVFVHSTESIAMYVANSTPPSTDPNCPTVNGTVNALSGVTNAITATIPVGMFPWAMAETPDGHKLYVVNRDSNNITSINTVDRSIAATIPAGTSPQWAVARGDSKRVYVLAADGTLSTIDSEYTSGTVDQVLSAFSVGSGTNYLFYDSRLNRLYIPFPTGTTVAIYNAAVDPPALMATIPVTGIPVSVTALQDGTRAYVASYRVDPTPANCIATQVVGQALQPCVAIQVTVIDETSNTVRSVINLPEVAQGVPGLTTVVNCADPTAVRFRIFAAAAADSTKVYVSSCDAGAVNTIKTSNDSFVLALTEPVSILNPVQLNPNAPTASYPPPQTPQFLVVGP